jgi:hypothetical protein
MTRGIPATTLHVQPTDSGNTHTNDGVAGIELVDVGKEITDVLC